MTARVWAAGQRRSGRGDARRSAVVFATLFGSLFSAACEGTIGDGASPPVGTNGGIGSDAGLFDAGTPPTVVTASSDASVTVMDPDSVCGDEVVEGAEECDDGNTRNGDGCDDECREEDDSRPPPPSRDICGDNRHAESEECEDGNTQRGDGCDNKCRIESCGNERIDFGEDCDPPVPGQCDATCIGILLNCGDGVVQAAQREQCDDGNEFPGDGCNRCRVECGDGVLERIIGEECEPVHALPGTCTEDCRRVAACGDGTVQEAAGEECDPSDGVSCVDCKATGEIPGGTGGEVDGGAPTFGDCEPLPVEVALENPSFDVDVIGWTPTGDDVTATRSEDGPTNAGSLSVSWQAGGVSVTSFDGVTQCISIRTGTEYRLTASYKTPSVDNPGGARASLVTSLYSGTQCDGVPTAVTGDAFLAARDQWFTHERTVDTSVLATGDGEARLLVKLGAVVPASVEFGVALFDDLRVERVGDGPFCGDCVVALADGEECDDGNASSGDGCGSTCGIECGNGVDDGPLEACDDGNTVFGDGCTPECGAETGCDACARAECDAEIDPCLNLDGMAQAGPRAGTPRNVLCAELRSCVHETSCNGDTAIANDATLSGAAIPALENCYCGTSGLGCLTPGHANGSCQAEVEAALETVNPTELLQRFGGAEPGYPIFRAVDELLLCESEKCSDDCVAEPSCGDGHVQDRTQIFKSSFTFRIDGLTEPCLDEYTFSGLGCSLEECDDGNPDPGDGCDAHCFVEACGNFLKQGAEECDDGNHVDGDGCGANCEAEYVCGDSTVDPRFEDCDPPNEGPVCSESERDQDPTQCGCDTDCAYKVCGNGVIQEGEDCDPPNGATCSAECKFTIDACTACVLQMTACGAHRYLGGWPERPELAVGCLDNPVCFDLWTCYHETGCHISGGYGLACYCGNQSSQECQEGGEATGVCKEEVLAAFEAQWERPPVSAAQLGALYTVVSNASFTPETAPFAQANFLQNCVVSESIFRSGLSQSVALSDEETDACVDACFP